MLEAYCKFCFLNRLPRFEVEALRKSAIEEKMKHEEERARCREYQRLYGILHEQVNMGSQKLIPSFIWLFKALF